MKIPQNIHEIIIAKLVDEIDESQNQQLTEWINQDERNINEYNHFCSEWYARKWVLQYQEVNLESAWNKIEGKSKRDQKPYLLRYLSIAVSILVIVGVLFVLIKYPDSENDLAYNTAKNEGVRLILSNGKEIVLQDNITQEWENIIITNDSLKIISQQDNISKTDDIKYNELIVPRGCEYKLILHDGTRITINSESRLLYPDIFHENERKIYLEGEACFDVAKNETIPFIVETSQASVRVLGTYFNVTAYADETDTKVTLVNGSVLVLAGDENNKLIPGQQLVYNHQSLKSEIYEVNASKVIAWTNGILRFDAMPLEQLLKNLSRWFEFDYKFMDEELKSKTYTGAFRKYDDLNIILRILSETYNINLKREGGMVIIEN